MNLEQLRAKYGKGTAATNNTTIEANESTSFFGRAVDKTVSGTKTAASAVGGVMPATRKSVKDLAAQMNNRINNNEKEIFKNRLMIEMIAQATGVNLPSDEEMDELYEEYMVEERELKKINEAEVSTEAESISPIKSITSLFKPKSKNGFADAIELLDEEVTEDEEEEIVEEQKEEPAPKEAPKGRRKLGRQAPLAE